MTEKLKDLPAIMRDKKRAILSCSLLLQPFRPSVFQSFS